MSMIKHTVYYNLHAPVLTYMENYCYAKECWVFGGMGVGGITLQQQYSTICTSDYLMSHLHKISCK